MYSSDMLSALYAHIYIILKVDYGSVYRRENY